MAREYIILMREVTVQPNPCTLVWFQTIQTIPSYPIAVMRAWCGHRTSTTSAQVGANLGTQVTSFPTLTSQAPVKIKAGDPASQLTGGTSGAAGTSGINASAEGAGTKSFIYAENFNILNGWLWVPTPDEIIVESAQATAHGFGLSLPAGPASTTLWSAGLSIKELG